MRKRSSRRNIKSLPYSYILFAKRYFITSTILLIVNWHLFRNSMYSLWNVNGQSKHQFNDFIFKESQAYFQNLHAVGNNIRPKKDVKASFVILSKNRREPYLKALLWSLVQFNDLSTINVTVINTDYVPSANKLWHELRQSEFNNFEYLTVPPSRNEWKRRLVEHHLLAMSYCFQYNISWCLIFEEDAVLTRNFVHKFHIISNQVKSISKLGMLKLFVSDHYAGFSTSWTHFFEIIFVFLLSYILAHLARKKSSHRTSYKLSTALTISLFFLIYLNLRLMGRQSLLNWFNGSKLHVKEIFDTPGTVAIAYPKMQLKPLIGYIENALKQPKLLDIDLLLNRWIKESKYESYRSYPSLAQHVGAYSSNSAKNQGNFQSMNQDSSFAF